MKCLEDHIGLQGCGSTTPDSGKYLNDLPGIELKQVDEIANTDEVNYTGVWAKIQKRALAIFEKDLRKAFMKKYNLRGITQSVNLGKVIDTTTTRPASAEYRGGTIELNEATADYVDSNFQQIYLQKLQIYIPTAETFNVKIYDLDTGEELFTESKTTTVAGWVEVNVEDYYLHSRRVYIAYDCTSIDSVKLDINQFNLDCIPKCESRVRGAYSPTGDPTTITYDTNNTHGLSLVFSIRCKYDVVVCNNKDLFTEALLYLMGSEMMLWQVTSSRTTQWTMLDNEQAKYMQKYFRAVYEGGIFDEMEFAGELPDAVNLINLDQSDCCINCIGDISIQDSYL